MGWQRSIWRQGSTYGHPDPSETCGSGAEPPKGVTDFAGFVVAASGSRLRSRWSQAPFDGDKRRSGRVQRVAEQLRTGDAVTGGATSALPKPAPPLRQTAAAELVTSGSSVS